MLTCSKYVPGAVEVACIVLTLDHEVFIHLGFSVSNGHKKGSQIAWPSGPNARRLGRKEILVREVSTDIHPSPVLPDRSVGRSFFFLYRVPRNQGEVCFCRYNFGAVSSSIALSSRLRLDLERLYGISTDTMF